MSPARSSAFGFFRKMAWLLGPAVMAGPAAVHAAPVAFAVTPSGFLVGSGYGVDAAEASGTLLDVTFSTDGSPASFSLASPGASRAFDFGTITLREGGQIRADETDDLGVAAVFLFSDPLAGLRSVTATGTATVGPVVDALIDYTITWNDRDVAFGNGGLFRISMDPLNFRQAGAQRTATATITLLATPVPEPQALALAVTALLAAGGAARRGRR